MAEYNWPYQDVQDGAKGVHVILQRPFPVEEIAGNPCFPVGGILIKRLVDDGYGAAMAETLRREIKIFRKFDVFREFNFIFNQNFLFIYLGPAGRNVVVFHKRCSRVENSRGIRRQGADGGGHEARPFRRAGNEACAEDDHVRCGLPHRFMAGLERFREEPVVRVHKRQMRGMRQAYPQVARRGHPFIPLVDDAEARVLL